MNNSDFKRIEFDAFKNEAGNIPFITIRKIGTIKYNCYNTNEIFAQ